MSDRIEEIRNRWSAATPGPWDVTTNSGRGEEKWRTIRAKGRPVVRVDEFTRYTRGEPETFCGVWIDDANAGAIGAAPSDIAFLLAEVERLQSRAMPDFAWEPAGGGRFTSAMGIVKGRVFTFEDEWHWEVSTSSAEMRTVYAGSIIEDHPERRTKEDAMKQCEAAMLATIGIGGKK